jgi:hypothetical protein
MGAIVGLQGYTHNLHQAGRPDLRKGVCSIMSFQLFSALLSLLRPPWQAPWGGNYWVQISLSYLYYLGYLVLGHFFPVEGCFPPVLFTVALGVSLSHLPSGAPFRPLG